MEHLQKQNILEIHRRMRGTPGWELLEEPLAVWDRGTPATRREAAAQHPVRLRHSQG